MLVALALNVLALALYSVALLTSLGKTSRALHGFDTQFAVEGTTTIRKWVDKTGNCQTVVRKRLFCLTLAVSDLKILVLDGHYSHNIVELIELR